MALQMPVYLWFEKRFANISNSEAIVNKIIFFVIVQS
jgi:hypothetical protein